MYKNDEWLWYECLQSITSFQFLEAHTILNRINRGRALLILFVKLSAEHIYNKIINRVVTTQMKFSSNASGIDT